MYATARQSYSSLLGAGAEGTPVNLSLSTCSFLICILGSWAVQPVKEPTGLGSLGFQS